MVTCRKEQDWTEVVACQEKSDENEKTVIELVRLICLKVSFMFVDAELKYRW